MRTQTGLRALIVGLLGLNAVSCGTTDSTAFVQLPEPTTAQASPPIVPGTTVPPAPDTATTTEVEVVEPVVPTTAEAVQAIDGLIPWEDIDDPVRIDPGGGEGPSVQPDGNMIFAYAPATIFDDQQEMTFYCGNTAENNGRVVDSIMLDDTKTATEVMGTTVGAWDSAHVCDPDVVEGSFNFQGVAYQWAMVYTGTRDPEGKGYQNQVGLAFSNDLRNWVKYPVPIVTYSGKKWGVGQPSLVSVDNRGQVLLFYTQGIESGLTTQAVHMDLSDMANGPRVLKPAWEIPVNGLRPNSDGTLVLNNNEFAYDAATDRFLVIRPSDLDRSTNPRFVSTSLEVAEISAAQLWGGSGTWTSVSAITPQLTGFGKNHNGGIATDSFGRIRDSQKLHLKFTGTPNLPDSATPFWLYDIYEMIAYLPGR